MASEFILKINYSCCLELFPHCVGEDNSTDMNTTASQIHIDLSYTSNFMAYLKSINLINSNHYFLVGTFFGWYEIHFVGDSVLQACRTLVALKLIHELNAMKAVFELLALTMASMVSSLGTMEHVRKNNNSNLLTSATKGSMFRTLSISHFLVSMKRFLIHFIGNFCSSMLKLRPHPTND